MVGRCPKVGVRHGGGEHEGGVLCQVLSPDGVRGAPSTPPSRHEALHCLHSRAGMHLKFCMMTSWMWPYRLCTRRTASSASSRSRRVSPIPIRTPAWPRCRLSEKRVPLCAGHPAKRKSHHTCSEGHPCPSGRFQRRQPGGRLLVRAAVVCAPRLHQARGQRLKHHALARTDALEAQQLRLAHDPRVDMGEQSGTQVHLQSGGKGLP